MARRIVLARSVVEDVNEALIALLDRADGDPDLEPEPIEDDGDLEPDERNSSVPTATLRFVLAERSRRRLRRN